MSQRHSNISIFVPHIGCPNMCSFCNQRHITGTDSTPGKSDIEMAVATAVSSKNYCPATTEIAFFGGSFTCIDSEYMESLLKTAYKFVQDGTVYGIRISTRPDAVSGDILTVLKKYGVTSIELGAQSLDGTVLKANRRGHTASDVVNASALIKEYGFSLGLQMMTGLYLDTPEKSLETAKKIVDLMPDTVRIYPTILLKDTELYELYKKGVYFPERLSEAVNLSAKLYTEFTENGISVIRLGLHSIDESAYVAGPWHPAFSELCLSKIMLDKATELLNSSDKSYKYTIFVNSSDVSKMVGQKRSNIFKLSELGFNCIVKPSDNVKPLEIKIERNV